MLKRISNAEWARIAAQAMKGKSVLLPDIFAGNRHLPKFQITALSGNSRIECTCARKKALDVEVV